MGLFYMLFEDLLVEETGTPHRKAIDFPRRKEGKQSINQYLNLTWFSISVERTVAVEGGEYSPLGRSLGCLLHWSWLLSSHGRGPGASYRGHCSFALWLEMEKRKHSQRRKEKGRKIKKYSKERRQCKAKGKKWVVLRILERKWLEN